MTHQYRHRIAVTANLQGEPDAFTWRGMTYHVAEVFARWHLRDRWWERPTSVTPSTSSAAPADAARGKDGAVAGTPHGARDEAAASDRYYYRVRCAEGLLCEVYWDAAAGEWILDRVID